MVVAGKERTYVFVSHVVGCGEMCGGVRDVVVGGDVVAELEDRIWMVVNLVWVGGLDLGEWVVALV